MKFIKSGNRSQPKISIILLDWSVRESFHLLHYLRRQNVERDIFEVIIVEYYARVSDAIRPYLDQVDTWVVLEMPESCYYHKHLMYNAGITLSRGEICVICDSDAMVKEGFIRAIIDQYNQDPRIVLHFDQFRNMRRDFYPFNYPSFEEVLGDGCNNNVGGMTKGILDNEDAIHTRNYGACMCARREDLIAIGGADEHIHYLGHICGPYDMTFRLINMGRREIWHPAEFLYHTWHPGQAGVGNHLGPHDGRHMSTTALAVLVNGRVQPLVENNAIAALRTKKNIDAVQLHKLILRDEDRRLWDRATLGAGKVRERFTLAVAPLENYKGFKLFYRTELNLYFGFLLIEDTLKPKTEIHASYLEAGTKKALHKKIDHYLKHSINFSIWAVMPFMLLWHGAHNSWEVITGKRAIWPAAPVTDTTSNTGVMRKFSWGSMGGSLSKLGQLYYETTRYADSLSDLVVTLNYLAGRVEAATMLVLVSRGSFRWYLKILQSLGMVARIPVTVIRSHQQLTALLVTLSAGDKRRRWVIGRTLYFNIYARLPVPEIERDMIVI